MLGRFGIFAYLCRQILKTKNKIIMKKLFTSFLMALLPLLASGYTQIDNLYYDLNAESKTAEVAFSYNTRYLSGSIVIPESVTHEGVTYTVTSIAQMAFGECNDVTSITIPNTVTTIGRSAFIHCFNMTSIVMPNSLESIGEYAFDNCKELATVTLPESLKSIGKGAFFCCKSFTSIKIPEGVTSIEESAFHGCEKLASVTLPSTITSIGYYAFGDCDALLDVYCYAKDVPSADDKMILPTFEQGRDAILHVPANSISAYMQTAPWSYFRNIVAIDDIEDATPSTGGDPEPYAVLTDNDDEITTDGGTIKGKTLTFYYDDQKESRGGMSVVFNSSEDRKWGFECDKITKAVFDGSFANCTTLTSTKWWFMFCKNLKTITGITNLKTDNVMDMTGMFYGCSSLTSLDLSSLNTSNLKTMFGVFQDCSGLKSINLTNFKTDKVMEMGQLFLNCSSLESLDVSDFKTDEVSGMFNMFSGCSSLKSLDLSNFNTKKVGNMVQMFRGCSNLTTIFVGSNWSTEAVTQSTIMFQDCTSLVGGAGTKYDANHIDKAYAHIDGGESNPGYFTEKNTTDQEDVDEITIKDIGKTTWCSEYDLDFTNVAGIKAYIAMGYDDNEKTIWLARVMKVPAGTGLLVKGDPGTYKIPHASVRAYYTNLLVGNLGAAISISETDGDKTNYYLSGKDGTFVSVNGSANIGKNKAYLQLPTSVFGGTRSIGISYDDEDGTTSLKEMKSGEVKGEEWYTLQGQRVAKPGKGLYIRNGKKVVIK